MLLQSPEKYVGEQKKIGNEIARLRNAITSAPSRMLALGGH